MRKKNQENYVFTEILSSLSKYFMGAVVILLLVVCFSGVRFIKSGNVALVLRFGKLVGDTYEEQVRDAGLLLAFPYIIDEVIVVPTGSVIEQKVTTLYTEGKIENLCRECGYVITGDQNVAVLNATVKYQIADAVAYALQTGDVETVVNGIVSNAMTETAASMKVDDILTSEKEAFIKRVMTKAQRKLDAVQSGIVVQNLELTKVGMPEEVRDIYEKVMTASVHANTTLEEAEAYKSTTLAWAESEAAHVISMANTSHAKAVSEANAALSEFWGVLEEYKQNREVVRLRIYNVKITEAIEKIGTVKVVQDGESKIFID